jgi:hypothetical protein
VQRLVMPEWFCPGELVSVQTPSRPAEGPPSNSAKRLPERLPLQRLVESRRPQPWQFRKSGVRPQATPTVREPFVRRLPCRPASFRLWPRQVSLVVLVVNAKSHARTHRTPTGSLSRIRTSSRLNMAPPKIGRGSLAARDAEEASQ